jgi:hypothetical protein
MPVTDQFHDRTPKETEDAKNHVFEILDSAGHARAVLQALREGRINGVSYYGQCACLLGTIANAGYGGDLRGVTEAIGLNVDETSPAEDWFINIDLGDTPATNPAAKIAEEWLVEWISNKENIPMGDV